MNFLAWSTLGLLAKTIVGTSLLSFAKGELSDIIFPLWNKMILILMKVLHCFLPYESVIISYNCSIYFIFI